MESVLSDYLISVDDLEMALGDPDLRVFETAANLEPRGPGMERELGRVAYDRGHIPGAQFLDLAGDAADTTSGLEFTLPEPAVLEELFQGLGINMDSRVVLYSSSSVMWSTRAWWLLHYLGYTRMSVLDGGFDAWRAGGRAVETAVPRFPRGDFAARPRADVFADKQAVADAIGRSRRMHGELARCRDASWRNAVELCPPGAHCRQRQSSVQ